LFFNVNMGAHSRLKSHKISLNITTTPQKSRTIIYYRKWDVSYGPIQHVNVVYSLMNAH
jgi:hypothetical protein